MCVASQQAKSSRDRQRRSPWSGALVAEPFGQSLESDGCSGQVDSHELWCDHQRHSLQMKMKALLTAALLLASASPALAQKEIPKAEGHDQCPLGYVNTFGTTCVSPIYYEVAPTNGEACREGWMNIGAGYCKHKKGVLGIF